MLAPVAHFTMGRLCGQNLGGAFRCEGLVVGEHVPDRLAEAAGEVDLGDAGAALFAEALFGVLVAVVVERVAAGVDGGLEQRPAQVAGAVFAERAAAVAVAGLVDAGAEAGVAGEFSSKRSLNRTPRRR